MKDRIEFLNAQTGGGIAVVNSSMVPRVGSLINILKKTWKVKRVTYALDHAGDVSQEQMRADVYLSKAD